MMSRFLTTSALCLGLAAPAAAESLMADISVRTGWRLASGDHIAALQVDLEPGWKTYWRAPGDAGIPPVFDWSASKNAGAVAISWPTPDVFFQSGMRSVGYKQHMILPIRISPDAAGDIALSGPLMMGLCKDICLPYEVSFSATLPAADTAPDPVIASTLADVPLSASEANVASVTCTIRPTDKGLALRAEIALPKTGGREETVIEVSNPMIWVAEPETRRTGGILVSETTLEHMEGKPYALDRSGVRITVLGKAYAVDIQGCG
jgi:DsbC/DsbD-like thiol-disulfide interchange protein